MLLLGAGCSRTPSAHDRDVGMMSRGIQDEAMREHCKMMPEMAGCEKYRDGTDSSEMVNTPVNRSIEGLVAAQPQKIVTLKENDSYALTASLVKKTIGKNTIRMLSYNGQIPGPIFRVKQGSSASIVFTNQLDEPTTVHWHGLRLDNASDGVPDATQAPVKPGESYTYHLKFPDPGLYWYHPHIREDYQQHLGMYGLIWVEPTSTTTFDKVNKEEFISLSDISIDGKDVASFDTERINHTLMGRFGNVMLVNGSTSYALNVRQGDVVRFAVLNSASTRVFKLTIPGVKLKLVGADGGGYAHDTWVDSVIIAPSERVLLEAQFEKKGSFTLLHKSPAATYTLGTITVVADKSTFDASKEFAVLKDRSADFLDVTSYYDKPIDKQLDMTITMPGMAGNMHMMHDQSPDGIEWEDTMSMMNQNSTDTSLSWILRDRATGLENHAIDWAFKQGSFIKIRLFNDATSMHSMQHPIHFHGNRFLALPVLSYHSLQGFHCRIFLNWFFLVFDKSSDMGYHQGFSPSSFSF
jgi:FtsP/CotA-like multicopper oxidase with cupredoxin domain